MFNKIILPALAASLILNCVLGYNLRLTSIDLKNAEANSQHYYNELVKEKQYKEMDKIVNFDLSTAIPEGFEVEQPKQKTDKKTAFLRSLPNIYIPQRSAEPYIPYQSPHTTTVYIDTPQQRSYPSGPSYDPAIQNAARSLNNIDVNMTLDSMFQRPYVIYQYPNY